MQQRIKVLIKLYPPDSSGSVTLTLPLFPLIFPIKRVSCKSLVITMLDAKLAELQDSREYIGNATLASQLAYLAHLQFICQHIINKDRAIFNLTFYSSIPVLTIIFINRTKEPQNPLSFQSTACEPTALRGAMCGGRVADERATNHERENANVIKNRRNTANEVRLLLLLLFLLHRAELRFNGAIL